MVKFDDIYQDFSGVFELKFKDFNIINNKLYIMNNNFINKGLIVFYAPWCKHCNDMSDEYSELACTYLNKFPLGAVNCEDLPNKNDLLASYANVTKYPTIKKVGKNGLISNFDNNFIKNNIIYHININL